MARVAISEQVRLGSVWTVAAEQAELTEEPANHGSEGRVSHLANRGFRDSYSLPWFPERRLESVLKLGGGRAVVASYSRSCLKSIRYALLPYVHEDLENVGFRSCRAYREIKTTKVHTLVLNAAVEGFAIRSIG